MVLLKVSMVPNTKFCALTLSKVQKKVGAQISVDTLSNLAQSHTQIADLSKYENVYFYIFNPNEVAVQFFFQESKTWTALDSTTLAAKSWTKVSVSQLLSFDFTPTTDITNPLAYVDVNHAAHENFVYEGWMISDFYGVAAE